MQAQPGYESYAVLADCKQRACWTMMDLLVSEFVAHASPAVQHSPPKRRDRQSKRQKRSSKPGSWASQMAWPAAALLLWTLSSSSIIFVNRQIMVQLS